ncbi:MAG: chemotaxis-specific protein-glutamate methyltransferase CheB [Azospirillum sp.]|nr:chemotaxis-specific protein-glutamate methyltransferase CheB [Azospirillum sp.]
MAKPIRVVIVDDSPLMRKVLAAALAADPEIEVAGAAGDPFEARALIKATNPDVVTLDVAMPRMDGLSFLQKIMMLRPMPVIMVSSLTQEGAEITLRALELGAVDYVAKPDGGDLSGFAELRRDLVAKVRVAATARVCAGPRSPPQPLPAPRQPVANRVIAIGASTGGVERIRDILLAMPVDCPPIVITQHMGAAYLASFAARLDRQCAPMVRLAGDGVRLIPGVVLIAPGNGHLLIHRDGSGLFCGLDDEPPVNGHRPSVDVLFHSLACSAGNGAVGLILSGMGRDGAEGLAAMRAAGAFTIGEQESSCVVYGMPRTAKEAGGVCLELPLAQIACEALRAIETPLDLSGSRGPGTKRKIAIS